MLFRMMLTKSAYASMGKYGLICKVKSIIILHVADTIRIHTHASL